MSSVKLNPFLIFGIYFGYVYKSVFYSSKRSLKTEVDIEKSNRTLNFIDKILFRLIGLRL